MSLWIASAVIGVLGIVIVITWMFVYVLEMRLLRAKKDLETANSIIQDILDLNDHASMQSGCCMCGESMENHSHPMWAGHAATDSGEYYWAPIRIRAERWLERGY